jgi:hypothetical protein
MHKFCLNRTVVIGRGVHYSEVPAVKQIEERLGKRPKQMMVDAGYTSRENVWRCTIAVSRCSDDQPAFASRTRGSSSIVQRSAVAPVPAERVLIVRMRKNK